MEVPLEKQHQSLGPEKKRTMKHTLRTSDSRKAKPSRCISKDENLFTSKAASIAWNSVGKPTHENVSIINQSLGHNESKSRSDLCQKDHHSEISKYKDKNPSPHTLLDGYTQIPIFHNASNQKAPLVNLEKYKEIKYSSTSSFKNVKFPKRYSALQSLQEPDAPVLIQTESSIPRPKKTPPLIHRSYSSPTPNALALCRYEKDVNVLGSKKAAISNATFSKIGPVNNLDSKLETTTSSSRNSNKTYTHDSLSRRGGYHYRIKNNRKFLAREKIYMQKKNSNTKELENRDLYESTSSTQSPNSNIDVKPYHLKSLPIGVDEEVARQILNEIVIKGDKVYWDDIVGLEVAKAALKEAVVYPFLRPDLFIGLREPARGILLFGPPGTGKTMLAKAVATESKSTFFSISASSLISKYLGESEKLVRALFQLAKALAPSIIFVDEIDSLLSSRTGQGEHESTRRVKTEFLIQWNDLQRVSSERNSDQKEIYQKDAHRVLVLAATNLPWAIDEAARRRFVRRQYIPLPEIKTRISQFQKLLNHQKHELDEPEIQQLAYLTQGFSGSDITALAKDAAMGPLRSLGDAILLAPIEEVRPIKFVDFEASLASIRPSVSIEGLQAFEDWAKKFGERGN
ncbi:hypothetical protein HI914_06127 [Erysiphe necator]|nr:hypothetical protein HI914_06127 [Erysiphe necator]